MINRPDWSREETILALDLYFGAWPISSESDPRVQQLSSLLRAISPDISAADPKFRNPAGVYRKLTNLLSLDDTKEAIGSPHASQTDRTVFSEFSNRPAALAAAALAIRERFDGQQSKDDEPKRGKKVWITGMWGFDPSVWGFLGFTDPATREDFLIEYDEEDLMLVVGQNEAMAQKADVGRLLGFLKLRKERIQDSDRMPPDQYAEKVKKFGKDRWSHALPVAAAWFIGSQVKVKHLLPVTYSGRNPQLIGSRYKLVEPEEAEALANLRLIPSKVFGEDAWNRIVATEPGQGSLRLLVSRGPKPHFGARTSTLTDSPAWLYICRLNGVTAQNYRAPDGLPLGDRQVYKIGWCVDPAKRLKTLNSGLPAGLHLRWQLHDKRPCLSRDEAYDLEQAIFSYVKASGMTAGSEFVIANFSGLAGIQLRWFSHKAGFVHT